MITGNLFFKLFNIKLAVIILFAAIVFVAISYFNQEIFGRSDKNNKVEIVGISYLSIAFEAVAVSEIGDIYFGGYPSNKLFVAKVNEIINHNATIRSINLENNGSVKSVINSNGSIYLGGYGDGGLLYKYDPENGYLQTIYSDQKSNYITSLVEDKKSIFASNSAGKLIEYVQKEKIINEYDLPVKNSANLAIVGDNYIVGGTASDATLFLMNRNNGVVEWSYRFADDIAIGKIIADRNNIIWGSTSPGNKIFRFDYLSKKINIYNSELIKNNYFWDLAIAPDGLVYFSTSPDGLLGYFDPENIEFVPKTIESPYPFQPVRITFYDDKLIGAGYCGNSFVYDIKEGKFSLNILKNNEYGTGMPITALYGDTDNGLIWGGHWYESKLIQL